MTLHKIALPLLPLAMMAATPLAAKAPAVTSLLDSTFADAQPFSGARARGVLEAQVLLDHSGHSPGAIDGIMGSNTARAISAFQQANGMQADGKISGGLFGRLREDYPGALLQRHTITGEDIAGPFVSVPEGMEAQADLDTLGFERPSEALAEKFHMAEAFLVALNPGVDFGAAGREIIVIVPGKPELDAQVTRIEVDKAGSELRAYASDGALVATYPATIGSSTFPSPDGSMEVTAIATAPTYHFNPEGRDWGPDKQLTIAAGPNNPVGGTWIDLSKDGYGIHGTPEPRLIGKTSSHGCVRLTNWDAAELAKAVSKGAKVEFFSQET